MFALLKIKNITDKEINNVKLLSEWNTELTNRVSREFIMPGYSFEQSVKDIRLKNPSEIHINASVAGQITVPVAFRTTREKVIYPSVFVIDPYRRYPGCAEVIMPDYNSEGETFLDIELGWLFPNVEILLAFLG